MKKTIFVFALIANLLLFKTILAQAPQAFNYQAMIRNASGDVVSNQSVNVKISILQNSLSGNTVYAETHTQNTNNVGLISLQIGKGTIVEGDFSLINWGSDLFFIKTECDPTGGVNYQLVGVSQLLSVPYALHAGSVGNADWNKNNDNINNSNTGNVGIGTTNPTSKLEVKGGILSDTLFQVKDNAGNPVFVVFNDGVHVYVKENAKGNLGGFAVSGRSASKGITGEYLKITPDSVRIYIKESDNKGNLGGFAVSGRSASKTSSDEYLKITTDSSRIFVKENSNTKGNLGGFAVSGRSASKGALKNYFNVSVDTTGIITPSQSRILWFPTKSAFLTGQVLIEHKDSVGTNSMATGYESKAIGDWSQAFGYKAIARGDYSTAIGKYAIAQAENSFAFGDSVFAASSFSFALGKNSKTLGIGSFAMGFSSISIGNYSIAIGYQNKALGDNSVAMGYNSEASWNSLSMGYNTKAVGDFTTALGYEAEATFVGCVSIGYKTKATYFNSVAMGNQTEASGGYSVAMGAYSKATNSSAVAMGYNSLASGESSFSVGRDNIASGNYSTSMGYYSTASGMYSIGIGKNTISNGRSSIAIGEDTKANGQNAIAIGWNANANQGATAIGINVNAIGWGSAAFGNSNNVYQQYSFAAGYGNKTLNFYSFAMGDNVIATGRWSAAFGYKTNARPSHALVIGQFNDTTCSELGVYQWIDTDPIFVIGNGTSASNLNNALTILKNGKTAIGHKNPIEMLDVNGNIKSTGSLSSGSISTGSISSTGNISTTGSITTTQKITSAGISNSGVVKMPITTITTAADWFYVDISDQNYTVLVNNTTQNIVQAILPFAYAVPNRIYIVKKISNNSFYIDIKASGPVGFEKIDGAQTYRISNYNQGVMVQSDGTNWQIIGKF